jgi:hypothetical protein
MSIKHPEATTALPGVLTGAEHVNVFGVCNQDRFKSRLPFFGSRQIANSLHGLGAVCYMAK